MSNILYQLYNVSLTTESGKEVNKEIKKQPFRYALIKGKRVSFSNKPGVSYQDICIDGINKESFIFISKLPNEKLFLLIYINNTIIFSGLTDDTQVENKINLYKNKLSDDVEYFIHNYFKQYPFLPVSKPYIPKVKGLENDPRYALSDVNKLNEKAKQRFRQLAFSTGIAIAVVAVGLLVVKYIEYREAQATVVKEEKVIDVWKPYNEAVAGSPADIELSNMFKQIKVATTLPNTAIKSIKYSGHSLHLELANTNYPAMLLKAWAKQHKFALTDFNAESLKLNKYIASNTVHPDNIMNIIKIKAWLIDQMRLQFPSVKVDFDSSINHSNYSELPVKLNFDSAPIELINEFFKKTHDLPLRINEANGSVTLGNFTGTISLNIIGDKS